MTGDKEGASFGYIVRLSRQSVVLLKERSLFNDSSRSSACSNNEYKNA